MNKTLLLALVLSLCSPPLRADELSSHFAEPPASARPWVYWFWNNGNVTKAGITADLEAMKRAGVGGVIIMDVVERFAPPPGTADFMNPEWQELFCFAVSEAHRLGLEINMTNGPGWCGSSGPWITPELSMQMLVTTNMPVEGPVHFSAELPRPHTTSTQGHDSFNSTVEYKDYYRDIVVLAFPKTTNGIVAPDLVTNLTDKMDATGKLNWDAPAGDWIIQRIGHTTTGSSTRPPVKGGNGLECDKLSREAMELHFTNMIGKLIAEVGPKARPALSATHIDSWEVGSQNWTPKFREEFQKRRGYDPIPFLPDIVDGKIRIGGESRTTRFRWDFQQTISELLATNYVAALAQLAHEHGLRLSLEGYHLPFGDEATYTAQADEPMSEFWATGGNENEAMARQMASVAHIMGHKIVGAEAFTSGDNEQWKFHPATVKALGDYEFSQGINRFVIHRYAHQPYLDRFPGATMGPWGLHYERTQTWWEMSSAWHEYLSRCQFMLRQGLYVADLCYLRPQLPDQTSFHPAPAVPPGYRYDECSAEALINRMNVRNGRLILPDGMSYRLLVLPEHDTLMTPAVVQKIKQLVADGATVLGPRPTASPSLTDFPRCDTEVAKLASEVWGNCDGKTVTEHTFGKGKVILGAPLETLLAQLHTSPDFTSDVLLNWIHRHLSNADIYFAANQSATWVEAKCHFRVKGLRPELWNPETGEMSPLPAYEETAAGISVPLRLEPSGSTFVVFRSGTRFDPVKNFTRDNEPVVPVTKAPAIEIQNAIYGVPGDTSRTRDVRAKAQALVNRGEFDFPVSKMAEGDDPAYGIVKTLTLKYTLDGHPAVFTGQDPDLVSFVPFNSGADECAAELRCGTGGQLEIIASQPGHYGIIRASGKRSAMEFKSVPAPQEITGPWDVHFPAKWGAPEKIVLDQLISLSESTNAGVKYFSGTATYIKTFDWEPAAQSEKQRTETWLDLGEVQVMAQVKLNGNELATLWKLPFRVNVTKALKPGRNQLEIRVANLWPNRMIGDAGLPPAARFTWSSYEPFTKDSALPKSGLIGPVILHSKACAAVP